MKEYEIRDLDFIENSTSYGNATLWCAREIELRPNVLNLRIRICKDENNNTYSVIFQQSGCCILNFTSDVEPATYVQKNGFKTFQDAADYANQRYKKEMYELISKITTDIAYIAEEWEDDSYL